MKKCPNCGEINSEANRFCSVCSASLSDNPNSAKPQLSPEYNYMPSSSKLKPQKQSLYIPSAELSFDYGEDRTSFLFTLAGAVCSIVIVSALIPGIILLINEYTWWIGLIVILGGSLLGAFLYYLLTCLAYIYSNISLTAKNSDYQSQYAATQIKLLNELVKAQNDTLSRLGKLNESVAEIQGSENEFMKKQSQLIESIENSQTTLAAMQEESITQIKQLNAAASEFGTRYTASAGADSSFKEKIMNIITDCKNSIDAIPKHLCALFAHNSSKQNVQSDDSSEE